VLCVNKNQLDNTDEAHDLWLRFHAAVLRVANALKEGDPP
jgi:hypothetical protein